MNTATTLQLAAAGALTIIGCALGSVGLFVFIVQRRYTPAIWLAIAGVILLLLATVVLHPLGSVL